MGQNLSRGAGAIVVWERDTTACSKCGTGFGLTLGRHHCRSCGDVVCAECSPYLAYLPQLNYPDDECQRVCTACAAKSHRVVLHEMAVAAFLKEQSISQGVVHDDLALSNVQDLFVKSMAMSSFNPYLLDRLRLQFATIFSHSYASALTELDAALRVTYVARVQLQKCIKACEHVRAVYLDHQDVFDVVDVQLLSDQIECARLRSNSQSPVKSSSANHLHHASSMGQKYVAAAAAVSQKKVRFSLAIPALPDFDQVCSNSPFHHPCMDVNDPAPIELDRIATYANDVICQ